MTDVEQEIVQLKLRVHQLETLVKAAREAGVREGTREERKACIEDVYKYCENHNDAKRVVLAINTRLVERFQIVNTQ